MKLRAGFLFLILFSLTVPFCSFAIDQQTPFPQITLSAEATLYKPADQLQMSIGIVDLGENAEAVLVTNSRKMKELITNLEAIGLTKVDYQTNRFSITPTYTPYPKNPPPDWKRSINGYEVSNSISIKTGMIDLAGKIIDAASLGGANNIENIHFALSNPRSYWNEAMTAATTNAIADANVLAHAAGVTLGRLISISLDSADTINPRANTIHFAKSMRTEATPLIEAGDVLITAHVSIVYEIADQ